MITITEELSKIALGKAQHAANLTVVPLVRPAILKPEPGYLLLDEALQHGLVQITETPGGGSVPELLLHNRGSRPVLLLDGEELVGAKQNRTLNLTILAPANATIKLPVSCVEAGRWVQRSAEFKTGEQVMFATARAARADQVTESVRAGCGRASNQAEVWENIAQKARSMEAPSPTAAMHDIYERHAPSLDAYLRAFTWVDRQAGAVFAIGGKPFGFDLFDHPAAFQKMLPKLVRSYALDAIDARNTSSKAATNAATDAFLSQFNSAACIVEPAVGLGKDVRLQGAGISGAGLCLDDSYVHLCGFTSRTAGRTSGETFTRMTRATRRANL